MGNCSKLSIKHQAVNLFWSAVKVAAVGALHASDGLEKLIFMRQVRADAETVSVGDAAGAVKAWAGGSSKAGTAPAGVTTGYDELDRITAGLQPGNLVVVAGRPGMGKSCLALNIAGHARSTWTYCCWESGWELLGG